MIWGHVTQLRVVNIEVVFARRSLFLFLNVLKTFPLPSMTSTQTTMRSISSSQCWTPLPGFEMRYQMCANQMCTNNILVFLLLIGQKIRAPKEFLVNGMIRATFDGFIALLTLTFFLFFSSDIELNDLPDSVRPNDEVS